MVQMGKIKIEDLEKLKLNELKDFLKENGCVTTGEKGTLVFRAKAFLDGQKDSMKIDGKNPALLKAAELRKECAARGLSPIGTNDELLERLIGKLQTTDGSKQSNDSDSGANEDGPIFLAQRIVDLAENQDWEGIMSVLGENLNSSSDKSVLRKTYLKLSLLVLKFKRRFNNLGSSRPSFWIFDRHEGFPGSCYCVRKNYKTFLGSGRCSAKR